MSMYRDDDLEAHVADEGRSGHDLPARFRDMAERLNGLRQVWETLPDAEKATVADINEMASVLAELLHVLAYGEKRESEARG